MVGVWNYDGSLTDGFWPKNYVVCAKLCSVKKWLNCDADWQNFDFPLQEKLALEKKRAVCELLMLTWTATTTTMNSR